MKPFSTVLALLCLTWLPGSFAAEEPAQPQTVFEPAGEIEVPEHGAILAFCTLPGGRLAVATGPNRRFGAARAPAKASTATRIVWLDSKGVEQQSAELGFLPRAVTAATDGSVIVAGEDRVAVFRADGRKRSEHVSPHSTISDAAKASLREELVERRDNEVAARKGRLTKLEKALAEIDAKPEEDRSKIERAQYASQKRQLEYERQQVNLRESVPADRLLEEAVQKARQIHRVAVSGDHVFLVCGEMSGYGYSLWRLRRDFSAPEKIVGNLSGCCGQMDVQIIDGRIVIAENSKHRVLLADFDGETVGKFGRCDRTDPSKGFGGCCNPMNTCAGPGGTILTSESDGIVKEFSSDGAFKGVLAKAQVRAGCKNSSIGIASDGKTLFYLDVSTGRILTFSKKAETAGGDS